MKKTIISLLLIISITVPVFAVNSFTYLHSADEIIRRFMGESIPGAAVTVVDLQNGFAFSRGYGYADADKTIPVTENTLFQTGTISSTITALTALLMANEGRIDLDAKVSKYVTARIPSSPVTGGSLSDVTLRMLMQNISGLPDYYLPNFYSFDKTDPTAFDLLPASLNTLNMSFKPYENISASPVASALLGYILAKEAYSELPPSAGFLKLTDDVLDRLGMEKSSFEIRQETEALLSYAFDKEGEPFDMLPVASGLMPAASLWSSASEMQNYIYFLLDKGWYKGRQLLPSSAFASLFKANENAVYYGEDTHYGLTWLVYDTPWGQMYRMDGGGSNPSSLVVHPEQKIGIFVTCNGAAGTAVGALADSLIEGLLTNKKEMAEWRREAHISTVDKVWEDITDYTGFYYGGYPQPLTVTKEGGVLYITHPETGEPIGPEEDGRYIINNDGDWLALKKHGESNRIYILRNGKVIARKMSQLRPSPHAESFCGLWESKSAGLYLELSTLLIEKDQEGIAKMNGAHLGFLGPNAAYIYGFGQGAGQLIKLETDEEGMEYILYAGERYYRPEQGGEL